MTQESLESRKSQERDNQRDNQHVYRFFGGPPLAVVGRLILLSILVGVILAAVGAMAIDLIRSVRS